MRVARIISIGAAAAMVSGCAGARYSRAVGRLQSQLAMLDERVGQLERASVTGATGISMGGMESSSGTIVTPSVGVEAAKPASRPAASGKPATRDIQQALKNAGFYQGTVDGKMGQMTREAIREFQRVHGLQDDGVVGKQTWGKLRAYLDLSSTTGEASAAEVLK